MAQKRGGVMTKLTLTRKFVVAKNYDEEIQHGVVYLEGDQTFEEGDYIENYWHILLETSGDYGPQEEMQFRNSISYYSLTLERSEYYTDDDSIQELERLEGYLVEWIADEWEEMDPKDITIIEEVTQ
jgi:hypothetical protein